MTLLFGVRWRRSRAQLASNGFSMTLMQIYQAIVTLTRSSMTTTSSHLLRGSGFALQVLGRHYRRDARALEHQIVSLSGVRWASVLERQDWPRRIGGIFGDIPQIRISRFETIRAKAPKLLASPGYVSSWQIVRA
jgi:hypothetical protein